jgi:hypothetical protein
MKLWDLLACLLVGSLSFSSYSFILSLSSCYKRNGDFFIHGFSNHQLQLCLFCFYWIVCVASIGLFVNYPASSASCNSIKKRGEEGKEEK